MKTERIIEKIIAIFIIIAILFFLMVCTMKTMRTGAIYGCDWRTIMWSTTIPLSIWAGYLWGKLLFSKK